MKDWNTDLGKRIRDAGTRKLEPRATMPDRLKKFGTQPTTDAGGLALLLAIPIGIAVGIGYGIYKVVQELTKEESSEKDQQK